MELPKRASCVRVQQGANSVAAHRRSCIDIRCSCTTDTAMMEFLFAVVAVLLTIAWMCSRHSATPGAAPSLQAEQHLPAPSVQAGQHLSSTLSWLELPDDVIARIVLHVPPQTLPSLAGVERRCRNPSAARLGALAATRLHDIARVGQMEQISLLFHEHHVPMMLLLNGRTILHTAIQARQLDLVTWLIRPLCSGNRHAPLSSSIIAFGNAYERETITPRPLPGDCCVELFSADGLAALRAAARRGDLELIDHLLPICRYYWDKELSDCFPVPRQLMVELRGLLMQRNEDTYAYVIDRRLRCSDICLNFGSSTASFADVMTRQAAGEPAFDWVWPFDEYLPPEKKALAKALQTAVAEGRVDLTAWLLQDWEAEHENGNPNGEVLADYTIFSPTHVFGNIFQERSLEDLSKYDHLQRSRQAWTGLLVSWHRRLGPKYQPLGNDASCNSAALAALIVAQLDEARGDTRHYVDTELLTFELRRAEAASAMGHAAMLNFLAGVHPTLGLPRLVTIVAGGAMWALEWLLESGHVALEMPAGDVPVGLLEAPPGVAPWLADAAAQHVSLGSILAALCASQGAVAMLEILCSRGVDLFTRFDHGRTILHMAACERRPATVSS